jgi:long-chain fatty acid transport protein
MSDSSTRTSRQLRACCMGLLLALMPGTSDAAGLYFSERGVRPMGRAGAFVAGADDLGALWYNPAGLADTGGTMMLDLGWLDFRNTYTRELRVTTPEGAWITSKSPTVEGSAPFLPIPTLAGAMHLDKAKKWTLAAGSFGPYVALASYKPLENGEPSPARYTLGSFMGSALAISGAWLAYKPNDQWRFGVGAMALLGWFQTSITFTTSLQDRLLGAPEQPEFDADSQIRVGPMFAPSFSAGVIYEPKPWIRFGLSGQSTMTINSSATIKVRLPSSQLFHTAQINGDTANVRFKMPPIARAGIEVRPIKDLRMELAYVREFWSVHDEIIAMPESIRIEGIDGAPNSLSLPQINVPRHFRDASSVRFGTEYATTFGPYPIQIRGGVMWEESAIPPEYLSLSSLDFDKIVLSTGASIAVNDKWRFDLCFTKSFASSVYVDPAAARIPRINPVTGNAQLEPINGGTYTANAELFGAGVVYKYK